MSFDSWSYQSLKHHFFFTKYGTILNPHILVVLRFSRTSLNKSLLVNVKCSLIQNASDTSARDKFGDQLFSMRLVLVAMRNLSCPLRDVNLTIIFLSRYVVEAWLVWILVTPSMLEVVVDYPQNIRKILVPFFRNTLDFDIIWTRNLLDVADPCGDSSSFSVLAFSADNWSVNSIFAFIFDNSTSKSEILLLQKLTDSSINACCSLIFFSSVRISSSVPGDDSPIGESIDC